MPHNKSIFDELGLNDIDQCYKNDRQPSLYTGPLQDCIKKNAKGKGLHIGDTHLNKSLEIEYVIF